MDSRLELIYNKVNELSSQCTDQTIFFDHLTVLVNNAKSRDDYSRNQMDEFIILFSFIHSNIHYLINSKNENIVSFIDVSNKLVKQIMDLNGDPKLNIQYCPRYLRDIALLVISQVKDRLIHSL